MTIELARERAQNARNGVMGVLHYLLELGALADRTLLEALREDLDAQAAVSRIHATTLGWRWREIAEIEERRARLCRAILARQDARDADHERSRP